MANIQAEISQVSSQIQAVSNEISKVVVGQKNLVESLLMGLFTGGHILLEGVPGLAKSLTVTTLAQTIQANTKRIQFTPDLLPSDLIGNLMYNPKDAVFETRFGPIFTNILLADEINRSSAKVQSALLEAMQEKQVTIGNQTHILEKPFLVLATQNPVDQEGTYPLPEAQLDRFLMKVFVHYPTKEEEKEIMRKMAKTENNIQVKAVLKKDDIFKIRKLIDQIQVSERLEEYMINLVLATRNPENFGLANRKGMVKFGSSPRGSISLHLAARAKALIEGRDHATPDDVKHVAFQVLNHRIILSYEADIVNFTNKDFIQEILKNISI